MDTVAARQAPGHKVNAVRPVGTRAVLAELGGTPGVLALQAQLLEHPLPGQLDVLAAAETVMVTADSPASARRIAAQLLRLDLTAPVQRDGGLVVIDTVYDGEDLAEVAELTGLGIDGVIAAHTGQPWTVAFAGFAPGFGYLVGDNEALHVPRRSSPRTAVPAGSVALAGNYSAVYPRRSPGGWQLIGRTSARMWDLDREQPALAAPGSRIQFRAVRETVQLAAEPHPEGAATKVASGLRIVSPGLQSLIQDLGRHGHSGLGVSAAGALDRASLRRANRLVGNAPGAAGIETVAIETVAGGLTVQAVGDQVLAVAGAPSELAITTPAGPEAEPARRTVPMATPFALLDGETLSIGAPTSGFRSYLAVRGGVDADPVLGSRSTDTMSGSAPRRWPPGSSWPPAATPNPASSAIRNCSPEFPGTGVTVLDVVPGPRADWFDAEALASLTRQDWVVKTAVQPVGMRLDGTPLQRTREGELASEGTVAGALQVPPEGLPVLFLADHPITGGYPVIAVVVDSQLDRAAQIPIGGTICFRWAEPGSTQQPTPEPTTPEHTAAEHEVSS